MKCLHWALSPLWGGLVLVGGLVAIVGAGVNHVGATIHDWTLP